MPGTAGTLVALPLVLLAVLTGPAGYTLMMLASLIAGIWLCGRTAVWLDVHDHGGIVWDEIAGLFVTLWLIPISIYSVLTGFLLFRVLDIAKPWPIRWIDRKVSGGVGIMLDDIVAGIMANAVLHWLF